MTINKELLERVLNLVEQAACSNAEDADMWLQDNWREPIDGESPSCGTAMCFAGWTPAALGRAYASDDPDSFYKYQLVTVAEGDRPVECPDRDEDNRLIYHGPLFAGRHIAEVGEDVHVSDWARAQLGLNLREAEDLFAGGNSLEDLRREVYNLVNAEEVQR